MVAQGPARGKRWTESLLSAGQPPVCLVDPIGEAALQFLSQGYSFANPDVWPVVNRSYRQSGTRNDLNASNAQFDDESDIVWYPHRPYSTSQGRFLGKDPIEEQGGMNLHAFTANNPVNSVDILGLWNSDVHHDATKRWALHGGYPGTAAERVATADNDVDSRYSYITEPGTQYHFNRSLSMGTSEDSRMIQYREHLQMAQTACTVANGFDFPELAAWHLGTALHPYQDWVAHGDHNYYGCIAELMGNAG